MHPFGDQVALVDKAVRDCQAIAQRYSTDTEDDDNRTYEGFRTNQPVNRSTLSSISLESGVYIQIPSKYASVNRLISVYATPNKSDVTGTAHPGLSVDTRFGVMSKQPFGTLQEQIRRESDQERELGIREADEAARNNSQQNASIVQQNIQHLQGGQAGGQGQRRHQTRRGRRGPRESSPVEHQQREALSNQAAGRMQSSRQHHTIQSQIQQQDANRGSNFHDQNSGHASSRNFILDNIYQASDRQPHGQNGINRQAQVSELMTSFNQGHHREFQANTAHNKLQSQYQQPAIQHQQHYQRVQGSSEMPKFSPERYGEEFLTLSPVLPPLGEVDFTGIPFNQYPQHMAAHIMENARAAGIRGFFTSHIPEQYRNTLQQEARAEILGEYYEQGLNRFYDEDEYLENYSEIQAAGGRFEQSHAVHGAQGGMQGRVASYRLRHGPTAQRGNRELAHYADELNQQIPNLEVGRLRGDTFVGEPALRVQPPSPNILAALADHRDLHLRVLPQKNLQSIGSRSIPMSIQQSTLLNYPVFDPDCGRSTNSNNSGGISDSSIKRGRSSGNARSRAADERRANSGSIRERPSASHSISQFNSAILAPSGIFSRDVSPICPRNGRFFDQSRKSSPGAARRRVRGQEGERSASAGNMR